ncbi:MAG: hypothetical protein WCG28_00590 [bacterium]
MKNQKLKCEKSPTAKHKWKTQTGADEDRQTYPRGDFGLVIGTFCIHCGEKKKEEKIK